MGGIHDSSIEIICRWWVPKIDGTILWTDRQGKNNLYLVSDLIYYWYEHTDYGYSELSQVLKHLEAKGVAEFGGMTFKLLTHSPRL